MKVNEDVLGVQEARNHHQQEADRIQEELDKLGTEFAEDGIIKTVLRERITQEKQLANRYRPGPGSVTCDRAGPVTIEDCKTCVGTGGCMYGKTEDEYNLLVESHKGHLA